MKDFDDFVTIWEQLEKKNNSVYALVLYSGGRGLFYPVKNATKQIYFLSISELIDKVKEAL